MSSYSCGSLSLTLAEKPCLPKGKQTNKDSLSEKSLGLIQAAASVLYARSSVALTLRFITTNSVAVVLETLVAYDVPCLELWRQQSWAGGCGILQRLSHRKQFLTVIIEAEQADCRQRIPLC